MKSFSLRHVMAYMWASPCTLSGVAMGLLLGGRFRLVSGVIEIHGPAIAWVLRHFMVPALAMTWGHLVFGQDESSLEQTRAHERVHVAQYERWGIAFIPAYLLCSLVLYLRGKDGYRQNPFEIEAFAVDDLQHSSTSDVATQYERD